MTAGRGEFLWMPSRVCYPSKGTAERGAWFRDSEGNLLGIGQPIRR